MKTLQNSRFIAFFGFSLFHFLIDLLKNEQNLNRNRLYESVALVLLCAYHLIISPCFRNWVI